MMNLQLMSNVKPALNQIEINPWFQRDPEVKWNQKDDVAVEVGAPHLQKEKMVFLLIPL